MRCRRLFRRFITAISFIPNPSLYPQPPVAVPGAALLGAEAVLQWWAAGRNYANYSPEGANPVAIIKARCCSAYGIRTTGTQSGSWQEYPLAVCRCFSDFVCRASRNAVVTAG